MNNESVLVNFYHTCFYLAIKNVITSTYLSTCIVVVLVPFFLLLIWSKFSRTGYLLDTFHSHSQSRAGLEKKAFSALLKSIFLPKSILPRLNFLSRRESLVKTTTTNKFQIHIALVRTWLQLLVLGANQS